MAWWIGTAKAGREFEVRDAIAAIGAFAWVARQFEAKRVPTKRRPVPVTSPFLARYVFIKCTDEEWHAIQGVKHLGPTMMRIPDAWAERAEKDVKLRDGVWRKEGNERVWVPGEVWVREGELLRPDGLGAFMERIDADYAARAARFEAGEKLEAYAPGDLLRILAGPLADKLVTFDRIVAGATDMEDKLRAKLDLMGGPVLVTLDPLHVVKHAAE